MFLSKSEKENHVCTCGTCDCGVLSESKDESSEVCDGEGVTAEAVGDEVKSDVKSEAGGVFDNVVEKGYYILDEVAGQSRDDSVYGGSFSSSDTSFYMNYLDLGYLISFLEDIFREVDLPNLHLVRYGSHTNLNAGLGLKFGRLGVFVEVMFTDEFMENKDVNMHAFICALSSCVQRSNGLIRRVVFDNRMGSLSDIDGSHYRLPARFLTKKIDVSLGETYVLFFEFSASVGVTCVDGYSSGLLEMGVYKRAGSLGIVDPLDHFFDVDSCKDGFLLGVGLHTLNKRGFRVLLSHLGVVKGSLVES